MKSGKYIRILAEFATGEIKLLEFKRLVGERLLELRQNPEMTDEKRVLSSIELYSHEAEEGLRDKSEVYAHVQFILDSIILQKLTSEDINRLADFPPMIPKTPYFLSTTFDVDTKNSDTEQKELSILASI